MIITPSNMSSLLLTYSAAFKNGFARAENFYSQVATEVPSASKSNLYAFLGQFPKMREWLGDRQYKNLQAHTYSVLNKPFESTVAVPKPDVEDDQYGVYSTLMEEMGYTAKLHPDELVFALLAAGASSLCYDGQFFFDTDHPVIAAGVATTKANYDATGAGNLWSLMDTRRPLKPLLFQKRQDYKFVQFTDQRDEHVFKKNEFLYGVDARCNAGFGLWQLAYGSLNTLDATNVQAYVTAMMGLKSDEDKPLNIKPNLCVVGPSNWAAARAIFEVPTLTGGAANPNYQLCKVLVTPHLT